MQTENDLMKVSDIIALYQNKMLVTNPEYQRGIVWNKKQKKKLVDSVLRGYPLPLIYLHHIKREVAGMQREDFEIIDGQQRITSLHEYIEGGFPLFDPIEDDIEAQFPKFLKEQPCPWAGKRFQELSEHLRARLNDTELQVSKIQTTEPNEVRDLFVRLQSGLPLNSQETRDSWPGDFAEFILELGGKPSIARYPGHPFFSNVLKMKPSSDRGKTRQLAVQIAILIVSRDERGKDYFADINAPALNNFYFSHIDFDKSSNVANRIREILSILNRLLSDGARPKLRGHDAIHLVLLVDSLWDDYTRSWEEKLAPALDHFLASVSEAKANKDTDNPGEYWTRYAQLTRVSSDRGETIARRHSFYAEKMSELMDPLQVKDPKRVCGGLEREIIYFRERKKCAVCNGQVAWSDAEIHHVIEHSKGGATSIENSALVHRDCHPKSEADTNAFAKKFFSDENSNSLHDVQNADSQNDTGYLWTSSAGDLFLPSGAEVLMTYKGETHTAMVQSDGFLYMGDVYSPSKLANKITNSSRNAWRDFWVKFPNAVEPQLASELREIAARGVIKGK